MVFTGYETDVFMGIAKVLVYQLTGERFSWIMAYVFMSIVKILESTCRTVLTVHLLSSNFVCVEA